MFSVNEELNTISFRFTSELSLIDRVIKECSEFVNRFGTKQTENLKMIIRELLLNAIEHGNKRNLSFIVEVEITRIGDGKFKIVITDQGDGFDLQDIDFQIPEDHEQNRSRGLPLINALADSLSYNEKGNVATAIFTSLEETDYQVKTVEGFRVITPSGNMTAATVENFRVILIELIEIGSGNFRFDFTNVDDIDSITLSVLITFSKMVFKKFPQAVLEISNAKKDLINLFSITRLNRIYKIQE